MSQSGYVEGSIVFGGNRGAPPAKYIIVPPHCHVDEVEKEFFEDQVPKALISVVGTKDLDIDEDKLEKIFNKGLVRAAKNTEAWIVTSGLSKGAADRVGDVIRKLDSEVQCIGIAMLNQVTEHELLENRGEHEYFATKAVGEETAALDSGHSHFFLVSAPRDRSAFAMASEQDFRSNLENYYLGRGVPAVLVIVGGDTQNAKTVLEGLRKGYPVVIVDQSGDVSDAIASFVKHQDDASSNKADVYDEYVSSLTPDSSREFVAVVSEIIKHRNMISIYDPQEDGNMDKPILRSVLAFSHEATFAAKMALGVKWGRVDIIEELLEQDVKSEVKSQAIDSSLQVALECDQTVVFEMLMKNGASIGHVDLDRLFRTEKEQLEKINQVTPGYWRGKLPGKHTQSEDADISMPLLSAAAKPTAGRSEGREMAIRILSAVHSTYATILEDPQTNLMQVLVWSILVARDELAEVIWRNLDYPIHAALVASHINGFLEDRFQNNPEYDARADWFEEKAIAVLSEASDEHAMMILKYKCPEIDGMNVLQIADLTDCKDFTSHPYVQQLMTEKLYGDENGSVHSETKLWQVFLLVIFPFAIGLSNMYERNDPSVGWHKFYTLPIVKLVTWTLSYVLFLFLLSINVVLSTPDHFTIEWYEYALWVWIATFMVEEIDQFRSSAGTYIKNLSNQIDVVKNLLLLTAIGLRIVSWHLKSDTFMFAYMDVLMVSNIICYFRLTHIFTVSKSLGTLFFIIIRLFNDVFLWSLICFVFMIGFQIGIFSLTKQAGEDPLVFYPEGTLGVGITTFFGDQGENTMGFMQGTSIGIIFITVYSVISQIMLVNLLIAMMGSTYSDVKDNADKEWKFYRYGLINEFATAAPFPPPLNVVLSPFVFLARRFSSTSTNKSEKISANVLTKMRLAKDKALAKERAEEINSIEFLSAFVRESTHQATVQANSDRSAIKHTLRKMQSSTNAQFKQFGDVLAKQQTTFAEMQASTTAQFQQFYALLATQQTALNLLQQASQNISDQTVENKEMQLATFKEFHAVLGKQQEVLSGIQKTTDSIIATSAANNKRLEESTAEQFQQLYHKMESIQQKSSPEMHAKEQLDSLQASVGQIQISLVNMHQSMDTLLKRTKS